MPIRRPAKIPEAILQLQQQLDQWRSAQKGRTKLPESFWQAAVDLAKQYGVFRTAQPLRLDYTRLKKRLGEAVPQPKATATGIRGTGGPPCRDAKSASSSSSPPEARRCAFNGSPAFHQTGRTCCAPGGNGRMIQITAQMRVLVAVEPVDGRKGIDSLARLCQEKLAEDPFSGCVFVFRSRRGTAIRLLSYDGQGYWLAQKRLSKGRFVWWPEAMGRPNRWKPTKHSY